MLTFLDQAPSGSTSTLEGSPRLKVRSRIYFMEVEINPNFLLQSGDQPRRARRPSVAPIQIPVVPVQTIPLQLRKRASRASRASRKSRSNRTSVNAPPSPGWASDSELEPASAVSGVSAARDVLSKSFSFSAEHLRRASDSEMPPHRKRGTVMSHSQGKWEAGWRDKTRLRYPVTSSGKACRRRNRFLTRARRSP